MTSRCRIAIAVPYDDFGMPAAVQNEETVVTHDGTLTARAAVLDELRRLRAQLDFVDGMQWGFSFMINPTEFPGRRSAGSLAWGGLANSYYWIDPVKKVTGVWASQLLPFYDPRAIAAFENFERAVYASL